MKRILLSLLIVGMVSSWTTALTIEDNTNFTFNGAGWNTNYITNSSFNVENITFFTRKNQLGLGNYTLQITCQNYNPGYTADLTGTVVLETISGSLYEMYTRCASGNTEITHFNITGTEVSNTMNTYMDGTSQNYSSITAAGLFSKNMSTDDINRYIQFILFTEGGGDTLGSCLTFRGYNYTKEVGVTENWLQINFSQTGFVHTNCTNVQTDNPTFLYAEDSLIVDTNKEKNVSIFIGGSDRDYTYLDSTQTPDVIVNLTLSDITLQNRFYKITMLDEDNAETWQYKWVGEQLLNVICDAYAPDTINLSGINQSTFYVASLETPLLHFRSDGQYDRKIEPILVNETFNVYNINASNTLAEINYVLVDYTGDFGDSYFQIWRNVNESLVKIWQQPWYNLNVVGVDLINDTYYQYVLYTPTDTRIIAWHLITVDDTITITVTEPTYEDEAEWYEGVELGFTSSYSGSSVGVTYNVSSPAGDFVNITFEVWNYSSGQYVIDYTTTVVGGSNAGSITHVVGDNNATYYCTARLYASEYTNPIFIRDLITPALTEERSVFYDSLGIPSMIGLDKDDVYTGVSLFLITVTAMMFTSVNIGTGMLVTVGVVGILQYWGWFRSMSWSLFLFLFAAAVMYKLVENRRRLD